MPNRDQRRRDGTFEYAQLDLAPTSDEPARCEECRRFYRGESTAKHDLELGCAPTCPCQHEHGPTGPTAPTPAPECRHCGGSGNAHTFDDADLGICGTCHGTGSSR